MSTPPSSASKSPSSFDLVVAMDRARGIAKGGDMPWHLPGDLAFFAKLTTGNGNNVVVMGRKTWETIPNRYRPLPRRENIVITRQGGYLAEGAEVVASLDQALDIARSASAEQVFVIGGAQIYALALQHPDCGEVFITEIDHEHGCEVFFPELPEFERKQVLGEEQQGDLSYRFTRWARQPR